MFTGLSDMRKSGIFTALVLAMATGAALFIRAMQMPAGPVPAAIYMIVPATATLVMLLVVTRDGYSKAGWRSLGLHRAGLKVWWVAILAPLLVGVVGTAIVWATPLASFAAPPALGGVVTASPVVVDEYLVGDNGILILAGTVLVAVWLRSRWFEDAQPGRISERVQPIGAGLGV